MWPMLLLIVVILLTTRSNELFLLSIRRGKLLHVRGRVPIALRDTFADVVRDAEIAHGTIKAVRGPQHALLVVRGIDEHTAQRLRNVFGIHPIHEFRMAPRVVDANLGQLLGWTWLAWLLFRR